MKKNKNIFITISILSVIFIIFCYLNFFNKKEPEPAVKTIPQEYTNNIEVNLNVSGGTYNIKIKEGATVYEVMEQVEKTKENNFSFKSKEYPGLGIFVDEINGIEGSPGKYWIYYVNDKEASVGVRDYVLKEGDIINWKQE
jgi:hypothetical protein